MSESSAPIPPCLEGYDEVDPFKAKPGDLLVYLKWDGKKMMPRGTGIIVLESDPMIDYLRYQPSFDNPTYTVLDAEGTVRKIPMHRRSSWWCFRPREGL